MHFRNSHRVVSTDELISSGLLSPDGYKHGTVKHAAKKWSYYDYRHDVTHSTNQVENFWRHFKAAITSTHIHVSSKYMHRYLNEFAFRANHRQMGNAMFDLLIAHA
jgi:transposase